MAFRAQKVIRTFEKRAPGHLNILYNIIIVIEYLERNNKGDDDA